MANPNGASTTADTPAETMTNTDLCGPDPDTKPLIAATVNVTATTLKPVATTIEARASARCPRAGWRLSTPNRHTRPIEPATSARMLRPRPRTPRLPASNPAVTENAPAATPSTTDR